MTSTDRVLTLPPSPVQDTLRLFDTAGVLKCTILAPSRVRCLSLLPGGTLLAAGCEDAVVRLWPLLPSSDPSAIGNAPLTVLPGHLREVLALAVVEEGDAAGSGGDALPPLLLSASADGTLRCWSLPVSFETGSRFAIRSVLDGHAAPVTQLSALPRRGGLFALSLDAAGELRLWDLCRDLCLRSSRAAGAEHYFPFPDNFFPSRLAAACAGGLLALGDSHGRLIRISIVRLFEGGGGLDTAPALDDSAAPPSPPQSAPRPTASRLPGPLPVSPVPPRSPSYSNLAAVRIERKGHSAAAVVEALCALPHFGIVATGATDGRVCLWESNSDGGCVAVLSPPPDSMGEGATDLDHAGPAVRSLACLNSNASNSNSSNSAERSATLLVADWEGRLSWWHLRLTAAAAAAESNNARTRVRAHLAATGGGGGGPIWTLAALSGGASASGGADCRVLIWPPPPPPPLLARPWARSTAEPGRSTALTLTAVAGLSGHDEDVVALAPLSTGTHLASGSLDASVRIWRLADGACERVLLGHKEGVTCLAPLAGGRLASGSVDGTILLWEASAPRPAEVEARASPDEPFDFEHEEGGERGPPGGLECVLQPVHAFFSFLCPPLLAGMTSERGSSRPSQPPASPGRGRPPSRHTSARLRLSLLTSQPSRAGIASLLSLPDGRLAAGCGDGGVLLWEVGALSGGGGGRGGGGDGVSAVFPDVNDTGAADILCVLPAREGEAGEAPRLAVAARGRWRAVRLSGGGERLLDVLACAAE